MDCADRRVALGGDDSCIERRINGKPPAGVEPYNGLFGADSPFYGLKLFVQHLDVSLEGNVTVKLQKQLDLGEQRLSEACAVAASNNTAALKAALNAYTVELKDINITWTAMAYREITFLEAWQ